MYAVYYKNKCYKTSSLYLLQNAVTFYKKNVSNRRNGADFCYSNSSYIQRCNYEWDIRTVFTLTFHCFYKKIATSHVRNSRSAGPTRTTVTFIHRGYFVKAFPRFKKLISHKDAKRPQPKASSASYINRTLARVFMFVVARGARRPVRSFRTN